MPPVRQTVPPARGRRIIISPTHWLPLPPGIGRCKRVRALLCAFRAVLGRVARSCAAGTLTVSPFVGMCYDYSWRPEYRKNPVLCTSCRHALTVPRRPGVEGNGAGDGAHHRRVVCVLPENMAPGHPTRIVTGCVWPVRETAGAVQFRFVPGCFSSGHPISRAREPQQRTTKVPPDRATPRVCWFTHEHPNLRGSLPSYLLTMPPAGNFWGLLCLPSAVFPFCGYCL